MKLTLDLEHSDRCLDSSSGDCICDIWKIEALESELESEIARRKSAEDALKNFDEMTILRYDDLLKVADHFKTYPPEDKQEEKET